MRIYSAGGAGINIVHSFLEKKKGSGNVDVCFVDSSKSNLKKVKEEDQTYLIEGMDGAGKFRLTTYDSFRKVSKDVLLKFKPDPVLNVVISSLSGGSGSVIGPMITRLLLEGGHPTVVIGVFSASSLIELGNTVSTVKSYQGVSEATEQSVCMYYVSEVTRGEADERAIWFMDTLSIISNALLTDGFDSSDIKNFLHFNKVTDADPCLAFLDLTETASAIKVPKDVVCVSTIHMHDGTSPGVDHPIPAYIAECIVPSRPKSETPNIRIDAFLGLPAVTLAEIEAKLKELKENRELNRPKSLQVDSKNSDGMVF